MAVLTVSQLCKRYAGFALQDVSFSLREGKITGFIGRNGAGKTTTLKSLLHFVHPDSGDIRFFDMEFAANENAVKQRIGYATGGIAYYPQKKLKTITGVTRRFYPHWDESAYRRYLAMFRLDENKTPNQLSAGMKVKYDLTLALSHHATLLILDEPTSGLDPVSRDDLLDVLLQLAREEGITILFSTHITSDLEKCADDILYLHNGAIIGRGELEAFCSEYRKVRLPADAPAQVRQRLIGCKRTRDGYSGLARADAPPLGCGEAGPADLESIMVHIEKE